MVEQDYYDLLGVQRGSDEAATTEATTTAAADQNTRMLLAEGLIPRRC